MSLRLFLLSWSAFILIVAGSLPAQGQVLEGHVYDEKTEQPIPFVNLQVIGQNPTRGTVSDIRGWYRLALKEGDERIIVSHVSFEKRVFEIKQLQNRQDIYLEATLVNLGEVTVLPGENPAIPIIKKTIANKEKNDPDQLSSYQYQTYNKTVMTLDGVNENRDYEDTTFHFLEGGHIFIAESHSEVRYKRPGRRNESIKASKISGIENPMVALASSGFQPFSFYTPHLSILEVPFVNPLSNDGLRKYDYYLEDSIVNDTHTTYIIQYLPKPGKVHQLLEGLIYISNQQYAIENMTLRGADKTSSLRFELQQKNEWNGIHWFPSQLYTSILSTENDVEGFLMLIKNQTFLSQVQINNLENKDKLSPINISFDIKHKDVDWEKLRLDSLTFREYRTYERFDEMDEKDKRRLKWATRLVGQMVMGRFAIGPVDLLPNRLLRFNRYERFALGLGLSTNEKVSEFFTLDGYFRYGFGDNAWKYGGQLALHLEKKYDTELRFQYSQDLSEPGTTQLRLPQSFSTVGEGFRRFLANRMDSVQRMAVEIAHRPFLGAQLAVFSSRENRNTILNFAQEVPTDDFPLGFVSSEVGLHFRWAGNENLSRIGKGVISWSSSYPVVGLRVSRAIPDFLGGEMDYLNSEFKFHHLWHKGNSSNQFTMALHGIWGNNLPLSYLNTGYGINLIGNNPFDFGFSFPGFLQTMNIYEFLSDRSAFLSYAHLTGPLFNANLGKVAILSPQLKFVQSFAIGSLSEPERYDFVSFNTMERGFWETGVELTNLLKFRSGFQRQGWGIGLYYRYGPYAHPRNQDNFSITLSSSVSF
ncbi:DUF5686 and carboxypeptidase-like regulatory domain-containing protein [Pararhodonellum marinum]|uniref:DUF5686 and carboxypeptidase-like regulatory domain-containing protein n=1 Tax=Pararhodonellum marinum TaxID=2755358 RepID=UPI00188F97F9|nr:DUF5686 and carboxypeptidase-like regulatory domain-containing protein [Pararhodonellum marinum]